MDLEEERSQQQQRQRKAIDSGKGKGKGVTRIGARIPEADRYEVLYPDGGINPNGIKFFSAEHAIGDIVLPYPRPDGTIALDSNKGMTLAQLPESPRRVEESKPKMWIFYGSQGKLWIGGHQPTPVEIGPSNELGRLWFRPGETPSKEQATRCKCHIWGSGDRWIASYQDTYSAYHPDTYNEITLTRSENGKKSTSLVKFVGVNAFSNGNPFPLFLEHKTYPLGAGVFSISQNITGFVEPVATGEWRDRLSIWNGSTTEFRDVVTTLSGSPDVLPAVFGGSTAFGLNASGDSPIPYKEPVPNRTISGQGTITDGRYDPGQYAYWVHSSSFASSIAYPILADGVRCYWINETIQASGESIIAIYKLNLGGEVVATNNSPEFFGRRWPLQEFRSFNSESFRRDTYDQSTMSMGLFWPDFRHLCTGVYPSTTEVSPVTMVDGQVVGVPSDNIIRATQGGGQMRRVARSPDGQEYDLAPAYCYPIPSDALIYHWCCDAG